jgi:hypothetical protein
MSNRARLYHLIKLCLVCARLKLSGRSDELPRTIYVSFRQLGGVYIKFLQLLIVQAEAFSSLSDYDVYDVYDNVIYDQLDINAFLRYELGARAEQIELRSLNPFAAGSFGQVYRAAYNGHDIVIKVLRPSVVRSLSFDLRLIGLASRLIDMLSPTSTISARRVSKDLARVTRAETDYTLEADYATTLHTRYQGHQYLHIPYTFREMSTSHIICQEYVDGVAATELLKLQQQGIEPQKYIAETTGSDLSTQMAAFGIEMLHSVFEYGTTYGDPHPGNIKFLPDNRVALIDYGLQAASPKNLSAFQRLVEQYQKVYSGQPDLKAYSRALLDVYGGDVIQAAYSLEAQHAGSARVVDAMLHSIEEFLETHDTETQALLEDNRLSYLLNNVINKNNRFCLKYDVDGPEFIRASILFTKLTRLLAINQEVLQVTYNTVVERIHQKGFVAAEQQSLHPEAALEVMAAWIDQLSYKNPLLHQQIVSGAIVHA